MSIEMTPKPLVAGVGEILWDCLPEGRRIGGAPANFAFHARQLGAEGRIYSRIGVDSAGYELLQALGQSGFPQEFAFLQRDDVHATGTVDVHLENGQPSYEIHEGVAWDFLEWSSEWQSQAPLLDALCYGTLAQRHVVSRTTIQSFLNSTRPDCLRFFDVNLRQHYFDRESLQAGLEAASVLKVNEEELLQMGRILGWGEQAMPAKLLQQFGLRCIIQTLGKDGSRVILPEAVHEVPGEAVEVKDAVGAGDAFSAGFVVALLSGCGPVEAARKANLVGAHVAGKTGAMPVLDKEMVDRFHSV